MLPMNCRTSATTWFDKLLRESNMVSTMPWIDRFGFSVARTCSTVCSNCDRPSSAKNSHCSGTTTASALFGAVNQIATYVTTPVFGEVALLAAAIVLIRVLPQGITGRFFRGSL